MLPKLNPGRKRKIEKIDRKKIAVIHVAKTRLGLTDNEYRDALASVGATSSKDLYLSQFHTLMRHFETLGFESLNHLKNVKKSRDALRGKVKALRDDLGLTDAYIDAIATNMKFNVDRWQWADAHQLKKLVAALTYHKKRRLKSD